MILFGAISSALVLGLVDHRTGRMPNRLTAGSLVAAFVVRAVAEGSRGAIGAVSGTAAAAAIPALFFFWTRGRAMGGGDVKALAAIGAWLGPGLGLEVELLSFSLMAAAGLCIEGYRGSLWRVLRRTCSVARHPSALHRAHDEWGTAMRFGPYLALGTSLGCGNHFLCARATPLWGSF